MAILATAVRPPLDTCQRVIDVREELLLVFDQGQVELLVEVLGAHVRRMDRHVGEVRRPIRPRPGRSASSSSSRTGRHRRASSMRSAAAESGRSRPWSSFRLPRRSSLIRGRSTGREMERGVDSGRLGLIGIHALLASGGEDWSWPVSICSGVPRTITRNFPALTWASYLSAWFLGMPQPTRAPDSAPKAAPARAPSRPPRRPPRAGRRRSRARRPAGPGTPHRAAGRTTRRPMPPSPPRPWRSRPC